MIYSGAMTGSGAISQVIGAERLKAERVLDAPTCPFTQQYKSFVISNLRVAERVGFEPTCRLPDKTLSRRPRYDHFGTSPVGRVRLDEHSIITGAFRGRTPG